MPNCFLKWQCHFLVPPAVLSSAVVPQCYYLFLASWRRHETCSLLSQSPWDLGIVLLHWPHSLKRHCWVKRQPMGRWEEGWASWNGRMNSEVAWPGEHGHGQGRAWILCAANVDMRFSLLYLLFLSLNFLLSTFLVRIRDNISKDPGRVVIGTLQHYTVLEFLLEGQTSLEHHVLA